MWEAPRRSRSGQYAEAALASPVRRTKSTAVPKRQPASPSTKGLQKDGGPCAVCFVTSEFSQVLLLLRLLVQHWRAGGCV